MADVANELKGYVEHVRTTRRASKYPGLFEKDEKGKWIWTIGVGVLPVRGAAVAIRQTGGRPAHPTLLLDYPSVQLYSRSENLGYVKGIQILQELRDILLGIDPLYLPYGSVRSNATMRLVAVNEKSEIMLVREGERGLIEFSLNLDLIVEPTDLQGRSNRAPLPGST